MLLRVAKLLKLVTESVWTQWNARGGLPLVTSEPLSRVYKELGGQGSLAG